MCIVAQAGVLLAGAPDGVLEAEWPHVVLESKQMQALVYLPDAEAGLYRGARFDWSGIVGQVVHEGNTYLTRFHEGEHDPYRHDAAAGLVDEFGMHQVLGYEEAKLGETFIKIGVGHLRRDTEDPYSIFHPYEVAVPGAWEVDVSAHRVRFEQEVIDDRGWGYRYVKTIELFDDRPDLMIRRYLKNTGSRVIETTQYNHNFIRINDRDVGANYLLTLPFTPEVEVLNTEGLMELVGKEVRLVHEQLPEVLWSRLTGFENMATGAPIRLKEQETGAFVEIRTDMPLAEFAVFAKPRVYCPEPFVAITLQPGESEEWTSRYTFGVYE